MELTTILNEPAVIGTGFVLAAVFTLWQAAGFAAESVTLQSLRQRELWQLVAVYVLFAAVVGVVIFAIRTYALPTFAALATVYVVLCIPTLHRYALGDSTGPGALRAVVWQLIVVTVASSLVWWWPW